MLDSGSERGGVTVRVDRVPRAEQQSALWPQDPPRLAKRTGLVGEEHDAELADEEIELIVVEGQVLRVGLLP